jgi:hypothetical protein
METYVARCSIPLVFHFDAASMESADERVGVSVLEYLLWI